ncbi:MAG: isoprenylcysteine carboxylmethyltransferase family protein [Desulfobacterales bacterium]|nr:isoprenylcysteine carboxylmethyltransferase family protein [Desulfobacterales bacterium]
MIGFLNKTLNPELIRNHTKTVILIWVLFAFVPATVIMFTIFLLMGSFTIIDLHLSERDALLLDAFLSIIFFLQHSILVRRGFKQWLGKFMPDVYHNAFYGLTSGIALLLVLAFWQKSPALIARADGIIFWLLRALFCLSLAGFFWGNKSLGSFDMLGVKPLMRYISNRPGKQQQIMAKGPYRWARHPLYLFLIVIIWSCPVLTLDRLIFNILWTVWIVIGTYLEDRDLHREFGSQYREYSSQVPMLIPYRIPRNTPI